MANNEENIKLVQYLDGELNDRDAADLESQLAADSSLRNELENLRLAKMAVQSYGLKKQVASVHNQMMLKLNTEKESIRLRPMIRTFLSVAASVLIILFSVGFYEYAGISGESIYKDSFQPYRAGQTREAGINTASTVEKAFVSNQPKQVINEFEKITTPSEKEYFYAGQSFLNTSQPKKAIRCFNSIISNPSSTLFKEESEYYLAMSYLKNRQASKAYPLFNLIYKNKDHLFNERVSIWFLYRVKFASWKSS
ncbi:MAG: hypothetical protein H7096_01840 [Flavobacterium sp.]|nr:hypothetical protein [Pedobacter sp.]